MQKPAPLPLPDDTKLAEGGGRLVFTHPDNQNIIIKIPRKKTYSLGTQLKRKLFSRSESLGPMWNSYVEIREYAQAASKTGRVSNAYAQFLRFIGIWRLGPLAEV